MRRHTIPRILLTILGIAMIALGAGRLALGIVGEQGNSRHHQYTAPRRRAHDGGQTRQILLSHRLFIQPS